MKPNPLSLTSGSYRYTAFIFILLTLVFIFINTASATLKIEIKGPKEALVNEEVNFSVAVICKQALEIESVVWDFGDLKSDSGSTSASHSYKKAKDFKVKVSVTVSYTDKEGKKHTDSGSDTYQITIKGKLKLLADPDVLPADGESTTTISAKVLDYNDSTYAYDGKISLSSSNKKALKVKDILVSNGTGSSTATAGKEPDTVTVAGSGEYLEGASCEVKVVEIEVEIWGVNQNTPSSTRVYYSIKPRDITMDKVKLYFTPPGSSKSTVVDSKDNVTGGKHGLNFNIVPSINKEGKMSVKIVATLNGKEYSDKVSGENELIRSYKNFNASIGYSVQAPVPTWDKIGECKFNYSAYCNKLTWQTYCPTIIRDFSEIYESMLTGPAITMENREIPDRLFETDGIKVKKRARLVRLYEKPTMRGYSSGGKHKSWGWQIYIKPDLNFYKQGKYNYTVHYYHKWGTQRSSVSTLPGGFIQVNVFPDCRLKVK